MIPFDIVEVLQRRRVADGLLKDAPVDRKRCTVVPVVDVGQGFTVDDGGCAAAMLAVRNDRIGHTSPHPPLPFHGNDTHFGKSGEIAPCCPCGASVDVSILLCRYET